MHKRILQIGINETVESVNKINDKIAIANGLLSQWRNGRQQTYLDSLNEKSRQFREKHGHSCCNSRQSRRKLDWSGPGIHFMLRCNKVLLKYTNKCSNKRRQV